MAQSEQFNVRINSELLDDLKVIAKLLKVNKSEWVKTKLAEEIYEQKSKLLNEIKNLYLKDEMSIAEIKVFLGDDIACRIESLVKLSNGNGSSKTNGSGGKLLGRASSKGKLK